MRKKYAASTIFSRKNAACIQERLLFIILHCKVRLVFKDGIYFGKYGIQKTKQLKRESE